MMRMNPRALGNDLGRARHEEGHQDRREDIANIPTTERTAKLAPAPSQVTRAARCRFPAPMFWLTRVEPPATSPSPGW